MAELCKNGANAAPASTRTEVEQATCTAAQLLSVSGRVRSPGPSFPGKRGSRVLAWEGGEERLGALCSAELEVRRVKQGAAG